MAWIRMLVVWNGRGSAWRRDNASARRRRAPPRHPGKVWDDFSAVTRPKNFMAVRSLYPSANLPFTGFL